MEMIWCPQMPVCCRHVDCDGAEDPVHREVSSSPAVAGGAREGVGDVISFAGPQ